MRLQLLCLVSLCGMARAMIPWQAEHDFLDTMERAENYDTVPEERIVKLEQALDNMRSVTRPDFYDDSSPCHYDLAQIFGWTNETRRNQKLLLQWNAYRGYRVPGFRDGAYRWTGLYDSCVDRLKLPAREPGGEETGSKYCWGNTSPLYGMKIGFCFPKSCSDEELLKFMPTIVEDDAIRANPFDNVQCYVQHPPLDNLAIGATVAFSIIAFIVILATIYDMMFRMGWAGKDPEKLSKTKIHQAWMSFSFYTNSLKIWNVQNIEGPGTISCLHGMRVISLLWVIIGHVFGIGWRYQRNMLSEFSNAMKDFHYGWLLRGDYSVDTFFFMSGLLTIYLGLKQVNRFKLSLRKKGMETKDRIISWVRFWATYYFHRYWRLTPMMAALIFFSVALYRYSFPYKGPFWYEGSGEGCPEVWWTNLLYINNIVLGSDDAMCQSHTWYLANDMQFYWISPFVLIALAVSPILGCVLILMGVLEAMITSGIITDFMHFPINDYAQDTDPDRYRYYYFVPWTRAGTYFIGMATGYLLIHGKRRIPALGVALGWTCSTIFALALTYGLVPIYQESYNITDQGTSNLYWSTNRVLWSLCMAWITVACHWGYGGAVNHFLSHPWWRPLSRLNYAAYLWHILTMYWYFQSQMQLQYFFKTSVAYSSITVIVFTYAVAYVTSATLEAPLIGLEKLFLPRH